MINPCKKRNLVILFGLFILFSSNVIAVEKGIFAVISPTLTRDGKPLLWKNRDSRDNTTLHFFKGSKYDFIGLIVDNDTSRVYMGQNTAGFAVVYNTVQDQPEDSLVDDALFVKKALAQCARMTDLEEMLVISNTRANFGCLDARGNCVVYETGTNVITKFDAADKNDAPDGFLVRGNFSITGKIDYDENAWRYKRAVKLIQEGIQKHQLDALYIMQSVARDIASPLLDPYPLPFTGQYKEYPKNFIDTKYSVCCFQTTSMLVFSGITHEENARTAHLWYIPGNPVCGIAVPIWPAAGSIPKVLTGIGYSSMHNQLLKIYQSLYWKNSAPGCIDTKALARNKDSIMNRNLLLEKQIITETGNLYIQKKFDFKSIAKYQQNTVYTILKSLRK